jgi:hypothetical protein
MEKRSSTEEVVDMELQCVTCGRRLYVPISQAGKIVASLERCGAAILVCICGQAQLIRWKRRCCVAKTLGGARWA